MQTLYAVASAVVDTEGLPAVSDRVDFERALRAKAGELSELLKLAELDIDEQHQCAVASGNLDEMERLQDADPYRWLADAKHSMQAGIMFLRRAVTQKESF